MLQTNLLSLVDDAEVLEVHHVEVRHVTDGALLIVVVVLAYHNEFFRLYRQNYNCCTFRAM